MVGAEGKVFSFEADPEVAQRFTQHVERNGFQNVRVVNRAVCSSTGSVVFGLADETQTADRGWGKVVQSPALAEKTIEVPYTSLDDFAKTQPAPDFIKCDVEGAECEVIMGAREMISEHRPRVACEVHSDQNAAQLTQLFGKLNYSLKWFTGNHFLASPQSGADSSPAVAENLVSRPT
jgi:FkbM family methyltransferase